MDGESGGVDFGMIQAHYIYCALYLASDHQALDPRGWGTPLLDKRRYFFGTLLLEPGHQAQATRRIQG